MKKTISFIILLSIITSFSQTQEIEVTERRVGETIILSAQNNTQERKEVVLTVTGFGYKPFKNPIVKLVNKNEKVDFVTLQFLKNQAYQYNTSATYSSKPTEAEIQIKTKQLEQKTTKYFGDFSKGIVVFSKEGCPRCNTTTNYLLENNIDFKYLNVTKDIEARNLMWKKLEELDIYKDILMPIILVNGKLSHTHKDLKAFLKTLN